MLDDDDKWNKMRAENIHWFVYKEGLSALWTASLSGEIESWVVVGLGTNGR